jgi:hypothetical protein
MAIFFIKILFSANSMTIKNQKCHKNPMKPATCTLGRSRKKSRNGDSMHETYGSWDQL